MSSASSTVNNMIAPYNNLGTPPSSATNDVKRQLEDLESSVVGSIDNTIVSIDDTVPGSEDRETTKLRNDLLDKVDWELQDVK